MLWVFALQVSADEQAQEARLKQAVEDLQILSADAMQGRRTGTEGNAKARAYILGRIKTIGLKPYGDNFEHGFTFQARSRSGDGPMVDGVNLLAEIKGKSSDYLMVLSAHYDHLGVRDGEIFNGADDNASGTAVVLAIADAMMKNQPDYDVIIALFDGEEMGLQGGRAFVSTLPASGRIVTFNMNLDMVARGEKDEMYVAGVGHRPYLKPLVESLASKVSVTLKMGHDTPGTGSDDWTNGSDHGAFHAVDIPFLYFGVEDHVDYHKESDEFEKVSQDFYRRSVESLILSAYEINAALPAIYYAFHSARS